MTDQQLTDIWNSVCGKNATLTTANIFKFARYLISESVNR
jgi:hypothetical protein